MFKAMLKYLSMGLLCLSIVSINVVAKEAETSREIKIKTNAHCSNCKDKIEKVLMKQTGVLRASVNMEDKVATVLYNPNTINEENINKVITDLGYKASTVENKSDFECSDKVGDKSKSGCSFKASSKSDCCKDGKKAIKTTEKESESK
jgi:copper chaperone CopZ